jgi:hypothetical protein
LLWTALAFAKEKKQTQKSIRIKTNYACFLFVCFVFSPKLYCLIKDNGDIIIKSKGISSKNLTEQDFVEMLYGICKIIPIELCSCAKAKAILNFFFFFVFFYKINPVLLNRDSIYEKGHRIDTKPLKVINGIIVYPKTKKIIIIV